MTVIKKGSSAVEMKDETQAAIRHNEPIESVLHVIIVVSNPCLYKRRYDLLREFVARMEREPHVLLYIVELAYGAQPFACTSADEVRHLQLRAEDPIWHKENLINLGVRTLLPPTFRAFAWIDADVEFDSASWVGDTLRILSGSKDVVQLFSHCVDMDANEATMRVFSGFGYSYTKRKPYGTQGLDYWHPGYAWAMTRSAFERLGGLFDKGVLGSGDSVMALAFVGKVSQMCDVRYSCDYRNSMLSYQKEACQLRLGYVPGVIRHFFHGTKQNRKYTERWQILMRHAFSPAHHVRYDARGLLVPLPSCPSGFLKDVYQYFCDRKEDDI
jgi:hypothetical protein